MTPTKIFNDFAYFGVFYNMYAKKCLIVRDYEDGYKIIILFQTFFLFSDKALCSQ